MISARCFLSRSALFLALPAAVLAVVALLRGERAVPAPDKLVSRPEVNEPLPVPRPMQLEAVVTTPGASSRREGTVFEETQVRRPDTPPTMDSADGETAWKDKYAERSLGQLIDAERALLEEVSLRARPYFDEAWQQGRFSFAFGQVQDGKAQFPGELLEDDRIVDARMDTRTGTTQWVALPHEGFEDVYQMREEARWLKEQELRLKHLPVTTR